MSSSSRFPRSFYARPTLQVARDLLGTFLVRNIRGTTLIGMIVEVEAYLGSIDPASHAYRGPTPRNQVMFGEAGHLYVYFTYGMHFCANVVTEKEGKAGAVLLRAIQPIQGTMVMTRFRGLARNKKSSEVLISSGPARLCQALGIGRRENGTDLCGSTIYIKPGIPPQRSLIARSERIGIRRGTEHLWRFFLKENRWVSR